ncbi:MerR family transcriptional regulator [Pseudonocardia sp. MH-G8]|nr:MerR family transcriptional regulator [Pseudonocardia sp. MH-G8]
MPEVSEEFLTTAEVARRLRLSRKTVYRYVRDGKIRPDHTLPGGEHRFVLDQVLEQLRSLRPKDG